MPDDRGGVIGRPGTAELVRFEHKLRNVRIDGRRTSLRLEVPIWEALAEIASAENRDVDDLVAEVERHRRPSIALASAVRVFALGWFRRRAVPALTAATAPADQRAGMNGL